MALPLFEELFPVLEVLDVEEAGDEAEEAVVRVEEPSPLTPLELPPGGDAAEAATEDRDELPGGDVSPELLLVPGATRGVGLFLDVEVVRSWGDATLVEEVESAYLQLAADGAAGAGAPWRSGDVGSWCNCWGWCCCCCC